MASLATHAAFDASMRGAFAALPADPNPFVDPRFLSALEETGALRARLGWRAHHLRWIEHDRLLGAAAAYLKDNSHGEFVFDHAWAHAHARLGLAYYPKLLLAAPYSPVPGPRLRTHAASDRSRFAERVAAHAAQEGLSSAHANFITDDEAQAFEGAGWLLREDLQFHWRDAGDGDFEGYLARFTARRRKEIRRERAQVARAGWTVEAVRGDEAGEDVTALVHACYAKTFEEKGNHPALTPAFFRRTTREFGADCIVFVARREGRALAMSWCLRGGDTLYGRYLGALDATPALHFEVCYYAPLEWCLAHGVRCFQPGAQGEHKLARGFLPARTRSAHWIGHAALRAAIAHALRLELAALERYEQALRAHCPFAERTA